MSEPDLWPRSSTSSQHTMWVVVAVVAIVLLVCLLVVALVLARKENNRSKKTGPDAELGFGRDPRAQPHVAPPPRAYDGVRSSQSPLPADMTENPTGPRRPIPPPLLTISPPEDSVSRPRRVPVPHVSPRMIRLPPSPHLNPPVAHFPVSSRSLQPSAQPSVPSHELVVPSTSHDLTSPAMSHLSGNSPSSAGVLERMMTKMEQELRVNRGSPYQVPMSR
ncbi:hypothetical protein H0H93_007907 [Arthromyces matolae]|nr:hypothetical protein H0H93_007907 [Arthromyces matolae]